MVDGLTPDFAPEAYSQGVGTGSAQVFDLGAPNPFQVATQTYDNLLAIQKDKLKTSYENEQKRQEKLDEFLSSMEDYDNAWAVGQQILSDKINTYGNDIAGMRAQGTAIDVTKLNKSKKEIADLAKANEANQKKYAEIASIMSDPIVYTDEERKKFEEEVKANANTGYTDQQNNGIMKTQGYLDNWRKSLATPDLAVDYLKIKPEAKSDKSGYIKATNEAEARTVVVDNVWAGYEDIQKKKLLSEMIQHGQVDKAVVEGAKKPDGSIDFNNELLKKSVGDALFTKIRPYLEYDRNPVPVRSSSGNKDESDFTINSQPRPGGNPEIMQTIAISKKGGGSVPPSNFRDKYGTYNMTPDRIVYVDDNNTGYEYVTDENGKIKKDNDGKPLKQKAAAGWYIVGKIQKEAGTKAIEPGESADAAIRSVADQKGWSVSDYTAKQENGQWKFYKLESKQVPYEDNKALMKNYGVESLEAVAAMNPQYKGIAGMSTDEEYNWAGAK